LLFRYSVNAKRHVALAGALQRGESMDIPRHLLDQACGGFKPVHPYEMRFQPEPVGGAWYRDPSSPTGWLPYNTPGLPGVRVLRY